MKKLMGILVMFIGLVGCIEVKGPDQDSGPAPLIEPTSMNRLVVDQPLFFWDGRFVNEFEWENIQLKKLTPERSDYEMIFDEIIFEKDGTLYTNGFNLRLHTKKLESEAGRLATFPKNQKAFMNVAGRSGGSVLLDVDEAQGNLFIEMRGEGGGDGQQGKAPDAKLKGKDGSKRMRPPVGRYGIGTVQITQPTAGLKGYKGKDGQDGGNTGTLEMHIRDYAKFKFFPTREPGQGGQGGQGGAGGEGGRASKNAKPVATGPRGDNGASGVDGSSQDICVFYVSNMSCF